MAENKRINNYLEMKIKTASPIQLIIMLYEKAIQSLNSAVKLLDSDNIKYDEVNNNILRAQEIISELMLSLDFEKGKEIAQNLYKIYDYLIRECIDANIKKDKDKIKHVVSILEDLKDAWVQISNNENVKKVNIKKGNPEGSSFNVSL